MSAYYKARVKTHENTNFWFKYPEHNTIEYNVNNMADAMNALANTIESYDDASETTLSLIIDDKTATTWEFKNGRCTIHTY